MITNEEFKAMADKLISQFCFEAYCDLSEEQKEILASKIQTAMSASQLSIKYCE